MPSHPIKLRGPWEFSWVSPADNPSGKVKMPVDWATSFGEETGHICFTRRFNCPTNLDENEEVFIVLTGYGGSGFAELNGHHLGPLAEDQTSAEFKITELLDPANQLAVSLQFSGSSNESGETRPGGLWDLVLLEIRS